MNREVFQANKIFPFGIIAAVCVGMTFAYLHSDMPIWIIPIIYLIGAYIIFSSLKTKLIIEDGMLRYEKLVGGEKIDLNKVSQIIVRESETIVNTSNEQHTFQNQGVQNNGIQIGKVRFTSPQQSENQERRVEKIIYFLDDAGRSMLSLPANTVGFKHRARFREAVHTVNPNIDVF